MALQRETVCFIYSACLPLSILFVFLLPVLPQIPSQWKKHCPRVHLYPVTSASEKSTLLDCVAHLCPIKIWLIPCVDWFHSLYCLYRAQGEGGGVSSHYCWVTVYFFPSCPALLLLIFIIIVYWFYDEQTSTCPTLLCKTNKKIALFVVHKWYYPLLFTLLYHQALISRWLQINNWWKLRTAIK